MKLAFPVMDDKGLEGLLADHFGRATIYTIYDTEGKTLQSIINQSTHFGGRLAPPTFLKENGVQTLICKGLGRKAIALFEEFGIEIFITESNFVKDALESYKKGELQKASEADGCAGREHSHH